MRRFVVMAALLALVAAADVTSQARASGDTFVMLTFPRDADGDRTTRQQYIDRTTWSRIVIGAWDAFERSGIDNVLFVAPSRWYAHRDRFFIVEVVLMPGYKPGTTESSCTLADAYNPDTESETDSILDRGRIRFFVGCSIDRDEPKKGSPEWVTAMSAILAHEVVHVIAPDCKPHDLDSSTIFGEKIKLSEMDSNARFSERVVTECFGAKSG